MIYFQLLQRRFLEPALEGRVEKDALSRRIHDVVFLEIFLPEAAIKLLRVNFSEGKAVDQA